MKCNDTEVTTAEEILVLLKWSLNRPVRLTEGCYYIDIHIPMVYYTLHMDKEILKDIQSSIDRLQRKVNEQSTQPW